jgi:hypothetical protein
MSASMPSINMWKPVMNKSTVVTSMTLPVIAQLPNPTPIAARMNRPAAGMNTRSGSK